MDHKLWQSSGRKPVNLGPSINTTYAEGDPTISADGRSLYFSDYDYYFVDLRPGGHGGADMWKVSGVPLVDVDGNGQLDIEDLCQLAGSHQSRLYEAWGKPEKAEKWRAKLLKTGNMIKWSIPSSDGSPVLT